MREPPADFVARLKALCGSDWSVRFNTEVNRWEFGSISAAGKPVSQFFGWYVNPLTGTKIDADPVTGLAPFRDLDITAQNEILANLEKSYIGNPVDGARDWETYSGDRIRYNAALTRQKQRAKAEDYATVLAECDLRRPWLKDSYFEKLKEKRNR